MIEVAFAEEDPRADDIRRLLERHLSFAREVTPPDHVHALDLDGLLDSAVTFFALRRDGALVGVGALRQLDETHVELKSMHVAEAERGQGLGRVLVDRLLDVARARGYRRVSLETGTYPAFAAARALYDSVGFTRCEPFADYTDNPYSVCMTLAL